MSAAGPLYNAITNGVKQRQQRRTDKLGQSPTQMENDMWKMRKMGQTLNY